MVSLYAWILHCLLLVSNEDSLENYVQKVTTWTEIKDYANEILTRFANADQVQELREPRVAAKKRAEAKEKTNKKHKMTEATSNGGFNNSSGTSTKCLLPTELQGDMVFENGCLFLGDALLTRLFADAIKSGDSGVIILVLKHWVFSYQGNSRVKYAHEMLHLFHNLDNVWTKELRYVPSEIQYQYLMRVCRKVVTQNWLLNPKGKPNAFVKIDLVQEHLNFWIKVSDLYVSHKIQSLPRTKCVYKAERGSHSWDWLALVSPYVDIL